MTYPKIPSPWKRFTEGPERGRFNYEWVSPEIQTLWDVPGWTFTEKIDGTNIRIEWDGYRPTIKGRTDKAQIPEPLLNHLIDTFPEELLEQQFGEYDPDLQNELEKNGGVVLYGEGVGPKIQKGLYSSEPRFVLFDVRIGHWWLRRESVVEVADQMGISVIPKYPFELPRNAVNHVREGLWSHYGDFFAEGVVGTAPLGLLSRSGSRVQVKIKTVDFKPHEGVKLMRELIKEAETEAAR